MKKLQNALTISLQLLCDLFLVGFGLGNDFGFRPLGSIGIAVALLRLDPRIRKSPLIFTVYWLGTILTLDVSLLLVFGSLYYRAVSVPAAFLLLLLIRAKTGWFRFLTPVQLTAPPIVIAFVFVLFAERWCPDSRCAAINDQPGCRTLTGSGHVNSLSPSSIPLFMVERPERGDVLFSNRQEAPRMGNRLFENAILRLDAATGAVTPWFAKGEVIALARDENGGEIYAIIQKNFKDENAPNVELVRFDADGAVADRESLNLPRATYTLGIIVVLDRTVIAVVEPEFYVYDKRAREIKHVRIAGKGNSPVYKTVWTPPYLTGVFCASPLLMPVVGMRQIMKIDMREMRLEKAYRDNLFGYYDVALAPGRKRLVASRFLLPGGIMMDFDLKKVGNVPLPQGTREIEFTKDGKYLLSTGFFDGMLYFMDSERFDIVKKVFVGKAARVLTISASGRILVGSGCGVVEVDPATAAAKSDDVNRRAVGASSR
ncbi:MAG: hypothetical protein AB1742_08535 [bacterium]